MRLQSALSMDQFQGIEDFGRLFRDKEEREERRDERRSRRRKRKRRRRKKKSARLQRRLDKLDTGRGSRRRGRKRGGAGRGPAGPSKRRKVARRSGGGRALVRAQRHTEEMPFEEPSLDPAPWGPEEVLEPAGYSSRGWAPATPGGGGGARPEIIDAEFEDDFQEFLELEGMGAVARRWSPNVRMGPNFRIQAAQGYRAAVIELKPGLFIVAELPEHVARSEFGIAPLLAPLVMRAATRAIQKPPEKRLLPKLFKAARELQAQGGGQGGGQGRALLQRVFQPKGGQGRPLLPMLRRDQTQARPQRQLVPAPGSGHGHSALLPAPALGRWVDDADLAGLFGCDDDGECGG